MSDSKLTTEAVQDALKAVLERSEYPSMAKIRAELDTTASQQTLSRHMKAALKGVAEQMGTGLPQGLPRSVVDAAHRFYNEARDSARQDLKKQRAIMAEREKMLTVQLADANQKAASLEQYVGELQQHVQTAEDQSAALSEQLTEKDASLNDSQSRIKALSDELADTRDHASRQLRQLRAEGRRQAENLVRERDQMEAARDREIERSDEQQRAWAAQIDQARQETRAAHTEHAKQMKVISEERNQAITQRDNKAQALRENERKIERLTIELDTSDKRASAAEATVEKHAETERSLYERFESIQAEHNAMRETLVSVRAVSDERGRLLEQSQRELAKEIERNAAKGGTTDTSGES